MIVDSPRHPSGLPTVFYGSRGLAGAEITIYGATGDLHSGNYGNFVPDPAMALTRLLASMKDDRGNVVIKSFYDGVVPLTASERRAIDEIPNVDQKLLEQFGVAQSEHPDSRIELQHNRPTLSVVGLSSGTVGTGARNAIPGARPARIEIRLVNGPRPEDADRSPGRAHSRAGLSRRRRAAGHGDAAQVSEDRARHAAGGGGFPDRQGVDGRSANGDGRQRDPRARSAARADADDRRQPAVLDVQRARCRCRRSASRSSTSTTTSTR